MKIIIIRQETIRPVYSGGKIFALFSYDVLDNVSNITDRHEKHLLLEGVEMLPINMLIEMCNSKIQEYRLSLQQEFDNGVD